MSFIVQPQTLFAIGPKRQFGGSGNIFSGYVTITESTTDSIEITQQPVQQGANIADHAFKKPVTLSIQILFDAGLFGGSKFGSGFGTSLSTIYQNLLNLQNSFTPFTCSTPKRTYSNMLFSALGVTTDKKTENILAINCSFQQIITVPITTANVPKSQLKNPGSNQGTQPVGSNQSVLKGSSNLVFKGSTVGGL